MCSSATATGEFELSTTNIGYGQYFGAVVADLNGDGDDDFATVHLDTASVSVQLGDGTGALRGTRDTRRGVRHASVAAGDLDGDGDLDLVTANRIASSVGVLLGNGRGRSAAPKNFVTGPRPEPASLSSADFDDDGNHRR